MNIGLKKVMKCEIGRELYGFMAAMAAFRRALQVEYLLLDVWIKRGRIGCVCLLVPVQ